MFTFVREKNIEKASRGEDIASGWTSGLLKKLAGFGTHKPAATVALVVVFFAVSVVGISKIVVNNNMVDWFKKDSEIRIADREINSALGGTSLGYVVAVSNEEEFIKRPESMRYIEGLQRHLEKLLVVGKTFSVADYVKRINRVLHDDKPEYDTVPDTKEAVGQYLFLFSMSAKPSDLDNVVDPAFKKANVWVQLKTWDAGAMQDVINAVDEYKKMHPADMELKPA
jgi:predicted RND superfamily exporter protein